MPASTPSQHLSIACRGVLAALIVVAAGPGAWATGARSTRPTAAVTIRDVDLRHAAGRPQPIHGAAADVLVRVRGGVVCSGTPITGTRYVVTAAHCVLDSHGNVAARTVVRHDVAFSVQGVLVDARYFDEPTPQFDAAVLVMDQVMPGGSATVGAGMPTGGFVTIAGFQALDSDGTLLRGAEVHDRPLPKGATGQVITIESMPAGCTVPTASLAVTDRRVDIPCGLIPGASGGGVFAEVGDAVVLVGIVSTVASDLTSNGVVPLASLHELLQHPTKYWHEVTGDPSTGGHPPVARS